MPIHIHLPPDLYFYSLGAGPASAAISSYILSIWVRKAFAV